MAGVYTPRGAFTNCRHPVNFARDACPSPLPPLMPHSHATEVRVRYAETDRMGVVYYANYLVWCEVGRVEFLRSNGRSYAALEADGIGLAVSEAKVRYLAPARFDDLVRIETTLTSVRSRSVTFDYVIVNA